MVDLIPSPDSVMQILKRTGAFRVGHFVYPTGKHSPHYFQMPLAFRYYDTAKVLAVALSRKFRLDRDVASHLPKVSIISPSSGGIPVAFGVRDALSAEQISKLTRIPTLVVFGDHLGDVPSSPNMWKERFESCNKFVQQMNAAGGDATMMHLPKYGQFGNSHMLMQDKNSNQVADLILKWIDEHVENKHK